MVNFSLDPEPKLKVGLRNGLKVVGLENVSEGFSLLSVEDTLLDTSILTLVDSLDDELEEVFPGFVAGADILVGTTVVRLRISGRLLPRLMLTMLNLEFCASFEDGSEVGLVGGCLILGRWEVVPSVVVVVVGELVVVSPRSLVSSVVFLIHGKLPLVGTLVGIKGLRLIVV